MHRATTLKKIYFYGAQEPALEIPKFLKPFAPNHHTPFTRVMRRRSNAAVTFITAVSRLRPFNGAAEEGCP